MCQIIELREKHRTEKEMKDHSQPGDTLNNKRTEGSAQKKYLVKYIFLHFYGASLNLSEALNMIFFLPSEILPCSYKK